MHNPERQRSPCTHMHQPAHLCAHTRARTHARTRAGLRGSVWLSNRSQWRWVRARPCARSCACGHGCKACSCPRMTSLHARVGRSRLDAVSQVQRGYLRGNGTGKTPLAGSEKAKRDGSRDSRSLDRPTTQVPSDADGPTRRDGSRSTSLSPSDANKSSRTPVDKLL